MVAALSPCLQQGVAASKCLELLALRSMTLSDPWREDGIGLCLPGMSQCATSPSAPYVAHPRLCFISRLDLWMSQTRILRCIGSHLQPAAGVALHCQAAEAITALAMPPTASEVACGTSGGRIYVFPLPSATHGPISPDAAATVFQSAQSNDPIVYLCYLHGDPYGLATLCSAVETSTVLCLRLWHVDMSKPRPEDQVRCLDSLRLRPQDTQKAGGWSLTSHGEEHILMCGHKGIPGRICVLSVGAATHRFNSIAFFALGRDAAAVRALRIDRSVACDAAYLQAISADGSCFDRLFVPWHQLRPRPLLHSPPSAASPPALAANTASKEAAAISSVAGAAESSVSLAAPTVPLSSDTLRSHPSGSQRLLVPGDLPLQSSASAAASVASDAAAMIPSTSRLPSRGSSTLLVPGSLSIDCSAQGPAAGGAPFPLSFSAPTAVAAPVLAAECHASSSPHDAKATDGLSASTGLDMLTNLFGEPEPSADTTPVHSASRAQEPSAATRAQEASGAPDGSVAQEATEELDTWQHVESSASQTLLPSAAEAAAAAAAAAVSAANIRPIATHPDASAAFTATTTAVLETATADVASGGSKRKKGKVLKDRGKGEEAVNGSLITEPAGTADGAVGKASAASVKVLTNKFDGLQKELEAVNEALKAQGEQVWCFVWNSHLLVFSVSTSQKCRCGG
jgi:hypothetical protein